MVIGGGVCHMHGGKAPQVKAKREARILAAEAQALGAGVPRDATEALLAAAVDADQVLQQIKATVKAGQALTPAALTALGDWLDRVARLSKTVIDAKLDERRVALETARVQLVAAAFREAVDESPLPAGEREVLTASFVGALQRHAESTDDGRVVAGELG